MSILDGRMSLARPIKAGHGPLGKRLIVNDDSRSTYVVTFGGLIKIVCEITESAHHLRPRHPEQI